MVDSIENNTTRKNSHPLAITLSILVAAIVGLSFSIIFINSQPREEVASSEEDDEPVTPADTAGFSDEIIDRYEEDGDYTIEDAFKDFEDGISSLDGSARVDLAIEYALFRYEYNNDPRSAIDILDSVRNLVDDKETEISYYYAYVNIYDNMGDSTNAAKYQNIIAQKYPDRADPYDVAEQKEFEYENSEE